MWDFVLTGVQPDLDSEFREPWMSLILFLPFAVSFLEHGQLPVDMQNIIKLAASLLNAAAFE